MPPPTQLRSDWKKAALGRDLAHLSLLARRGACLDWRLSNEFGVHGPMTALHLACLQDWSEGALWLVNAGASVDVFTRAFATPVSFAVKGGHLEVVRALLGKSLHTLDVVSVWDESPLHVAVCNEDLPMARLLLAFGAGNQKNSVGMSPHDLAMELGASSIAAAIEAHCAEREHATLDQAVAPIAKRTPLSRI